MMARMISALFFALATMSTTSFSSAMDMPWNFSVGLIMVPLALITVPPPAPAGRAASMTMSE